VLKAEVVYELVVRFGQASRKPLVPPINLSAYGLPIPGLTGPVISSGAVQSFFPKDPKQTAVAFRRARIA